MIFQNPSTLQEAWPVILLAAAALQHNALLITADTDFTRFRELRVGII